MTTMRDALAKALDAKVGVGLSPELYADDILADPAFRAALVASIAEALSIPDEPPGWAWLETEDKRLAARAAAIVARMLGETP